MAINLNKDGEESGKRESGSDKPKSSINLGKSDSPDKKPIDLKKSVTHNPSTESTSSNVYEPASGNISSEQSDSESGSKLFRWLGILFFVLVGAGIAYFSAKKKADSSANETKSDAVAPAATTTDTISAVDRGPATGVPDSATLPDINASAGVGGGNGATGTAQSGQPATTSEPAAAVKQAESKPANAGPSTNTTTKPAETVSASAGSNETIRALFQSGSSSGSALSGNDIRKIKDYLKRNPAGRIVVEGFASSEGDAGLNQQLSVQRAERIKKFMISRGIASGSIEATGRGTENPVGDNNTAEGRKLNRRAQITLQ
jgi:outer membrane protein OmpA-like peptidoglycan-associated protein